MSENPPEVPVQDDEATHPHEDAGDLVEPDEDA